VFLHEWLHHLDAFYTEKGVHQPKGGPDGARQYGYKSEPPEFWRPFYRDLMNGTIHDGGEQVGLGEKAWQFGTIRAAVATRPLPWRKPPPTVVLEPPRGFDLCFSPKFLTKKRRQLNLLKNPSFEAGLDGWKCQSYRGKTQAAQIDSSEPREGQKCVRIAAEVDDVQLVQRVRLKPFTSYLFSGWVRTEDLKLAQEGGTVGANLGTMNLRAEHGPTLVGTNPWTYLVTMFYTGQDPEIELAAHLGHMGSTVTGKAWFDDLCLIELSPR
jgi:hypothetical protein